MTYADQSKDEIRKINMRECYADALHQAGRLDDADSLFREAVRMQGTGLQFVGFKYCELLLRAPELAAWRRIQSLEVRHQESKLLKACREVSRHAVQALQILEKVGDQGLINNGLGQLTLARAALFEMIFGKAEIQRVISEVKVAVSRLRDAGVQDHLIRGCLTRSQVRFLSGELRGPESAASDLDEVWEIAERGPMRLHMADIHLYRARLFFREANYPWESPEKDLAEARKLIEQCGYWRREEELEDAEEAILRKSQGNSR